MAIMSWFAWVINWELQGREETRIFQGNFMAVFSPVKEVFLNRCRMKIFG
jgi:hypothetical protein